MWDKIAATALRTRWIVRAPIGAYRVGLGFLFGSRILMLEHRGRVSRTWRYVMLEVVEHTSPDVYVVVAGFGPSAQWYQNVVADPDVRVSCGRIRSADARARPMTPDDAAAALDRYVIAHPNAWRRLQGALAAAGGHPVDQLPMVRLELTRP